MTDLLSTTDDVTATTAGAQADDAAARAGVDIHLARGEADVRVAVEIIDSVWSADGSPSTLPYTALRALVHAGNYASLATRDGEPIGVLTGFLGWHDGPSMHSHIAATRPGRTGRGVGLALKLHQRAWAITRGLDDMTWTFDPLVRRNAWFNLGKLGVIGATYLRNFYGEMNDAVNGRTESDRLLASWHLRSERVHRTIEDGPQAPDGTPVIVLEDVEGRPVALSGDGNLLGIRVPVDIEGMRRQDAGLADQWRLAVREELGGRLADGWTASGFTRDGLFLLTRRP